MKGIRKKSKLVRVDPFFVDVANRYRVNFEKEFGFPISNPNVSRQMAEVFDKMLKVNGMPVIKNKDKRRKVKTCQIFWEFDL